MNITTSNNTATTGTITTSTTGTTTCSNLIYTGGNTNMGNTFNYQPYTYSTSFTYLYLTMKSKAHIKQLRIVKRILRQNKMYASAGTICR